MILLLILLNSLWIIGFYISFQEGMIFEKLNPYPYLNAWKPHNVFLKQIFKPVIGCPVCMASVHGLLFLFFFQSIVSETNLISLLDFKCLVFYIFALAGMNLLTVKITDI